MEENLEFSKEWLIAEIIKNDFEEKQSKTKKMVSMEYRNLLNLILKFVKLNEEV